MIEWLHTTCVKLDTESISSETEKSLCEQLSKLLQCGQDMYRNKQSPAEICMCQELIDASHTPLVDWLNKTIKFFDSAWLAGERESNVATLLMSMIQMHVDKFVSEGPAVKSLFSVDMMRTQQQGQSIGVVGGGGYGAGADGWNNGGGYDMYGG